MVGPAPVHHPPDQPSPLAGRRWPGTGWRPRTTCARRSSARSWATGCRRARVIDLGCLEGAFSIELARRGAQHVLGVEARQLSVDRCNLVGDLLGLTNVSFRCADLHDELRRAPDGFDAVLATGILYHLPDPAASLNAIRAACRGFALVDTHVAVLEGPTHHCSEDLTELQSGAQSYRGRTFWEYDVTATDTDLQGYTWAAYGNPESFWPLEDDLVRMIDDAGFSSGEQDRPEHEAGAVAGRQAQPCHVPLPGLIVCPVSRRTR